MTDENSQTMATSTIKKAIYFGPHIVTSQVFYTTPHSYALTNLRPLLPGHILICSHRRVPHLSSLSPPELQDFFQTVQLASITLKRVYKASACNIAIQDGKAAGQSVEHLHCHLIPRTEGDMDDRGGGDAIYEMLEGSEGDVGGHLREKEEGERRGRLPKVEDKDRKDRSLSVMEAEARWLAEEMQKDVKDFGNTQT